MLRLILGLLAFAAAAAPANATDREYVRRLEALALLQSFNAELLSHPSATAVLQDVCDRRSGGFKIVARTTRGLEAPAGPDERVALQIGADEPVRYRRVELACGAEVLSRAENWYLPSRLTPEMNRALDESDTPFGVVVKPLAFERRTLSARLLFEPLPPGWAWGKARRYPPLKVPPEVLRHRAVLTTPDGRPFSLVVETYSDRVLAPLVDRRR